MKPVRHFHFLFSGFSQKWSDPSNGFAIVYRRLREEYPESEVIFLPWYVDHRDLARMVIGNGKHLHPERARVTVAGYSFGGTTALNLCKALYLQGQQPVDALCLVDAVKRRSLYPHGWLAAFNRAATLRVPRNVERATSFFQRENWPRGHRVRAEKGLVAKIGHIRLSDPHVAMDSHEMVRNTIIQQAEGVH